MTADLFSLEGKVILITGGSGHLGSELCRGLSGAGAKVYATGRALEKFFALDGMGDFDCFAVDATDVPRMTALVDRILEREGRLDALINNACSAPRGIDLDTPAEDIAAGLSNAFTHYLTTAQIALKPMRQAKRGVILNTASLWGMHAPNPAVYLDLKNEPPVWLPAAKAAVIGLTQTLASLCASDGIRVNAVSPGWFPRKRGPNREDYMRELTARIPMGRIGRPEELVGTYAYLLSEASSYVTGQNLVVDGGFGIW